jgi:hypothetical protein
MMSDELQRPFLYRSTRAWLGVAQCVCGDDIYILTEEDCIALLACCNVLKSEERGKSKEPLTDKRE